MNKVEVPIGAIITSNQKSIKGYYLCDGSLVKINQNKKLFKAIGYTYAKTFDKKKDTHFRLPSFRSCLIIKKYLIDLTKVVKCSFFQRHNIDGKYEIRAECISLKEGYSAYDILKKDTLINKIENIIKSLFNKDYYDEEVEIILPNNSNYKNKLNYFIRVH